MTEQGRTGSATDDTIETRRLAGIVLSRIASEPGDEAAVAKDLGFILDTKVGSDLWRIELSRLIAALVAGGLVERDRTLLRATASGLAATSEFLGLKRSHSANWGVTRDVLLVAKALDLATAPASRLKLLRKPDGLRALIVTQHWQLGIKGPPSPQRVRSALAAKALGQAFGNQVGSSIGDKSSLPAKAGRLLAAKLSSSGREFSSDGRLVAALAAEASGSRRSDLKSLQIAVLRRFLGIADKSDAKRKGHRKLAVRPPRTTRSSPPAHGETIESGKVIADESTTYPLTGAQPPFGDRPSPSAFAAAVQRAASETAEGWPGNRKAFISKVWAIVRDRHPGWQLTEIEFKCMLAEAHRTGLVALANADLKDKRALKEINDSAVLYKNAVWHYVRAAD